MVWVNNGDEYLDKISNYRTILGVCIALPILTTVVVGLRGYVRGKLLRTLGFDDYVVFFGAICGIIYAGLCIGQSKWGLGLPIKLRPKKNLNEYAVINFAGRPFYMFGILAFKVALCLAYLRILRTSTNVVYRYVIWIILILCTIGHVAGTLILIFQCSPVKKSWLPLTPGTCLPNDSTFYALAAVTIVFDVIIFFLPIPMLLQLNIEMKKKVVLCAVFLLGLLTTVCSILRLVQIGAIATSGNSTMLVLWGVIELNIGIILTCIPTLGPLIPYFRNASDYRNTHSKNAYQLSSTPGQRSAKRSTVLATGPPGAQFDKYGDYRPDIVAAHKVNASDSSSDEDRIRLKDGTDNVGLAFGGAGSGAGGGGILKTTDVRVSDEEQRVVPTGETDSGNFTRTW